MNTQNDRRADSKTVVVSIIDHKGDLGRYSFRFAGPAGNCASYDYATLTDAQDHARGFVRSIWPGAEVLFQYGAFTPQQQAANGELA